MVIKKIISAGLTVADQTALDVAIKLGIPYTGWIPKGKIAETGPLPSKYQLEEMPTAVVPECIEKNVLEAKGTLIILSGRLTGNYAYAERMTLKHRRQLLGIDLKQFVAVKAASLVNDWIQLQRVDKLYVIGPSASEFPGIETHTKLIVEGALLLDMKGAPRNSRITDYSNEKYLERVFIPPKTVDEAVNHIISDLPLQDRVRIANMQRKDLEIVYMTLGLFIKKQLLQKDMNKELLESCRTVSGNNNLNEITASFVIIEKLWEKLRDTHKLRILKT